jgi:hypothetical protein
MFLFNSEKVVRAHSLGMEFCARRSKKMLGQLELKLNGEARNKKKPFQKIKNVLSFKKNIYVTFVIHRFRISIG